MDVIIYHNPDCGTSRNTMGLIHNAGVEPHVIEYLKTPPTRALLELLIGRMGIPVRALLRQKGTPYDQLGLDNPGLTDDQLLDAMMAHPILINRPIVVTPAGVRLCRPSEACSTFCLSRNRENSAKKMESLWLGRMAAACSAHQPDHGLRKPLRRLTPRDGLQSHRLAVTRPSISATRSRPLATPARPR
jgi:arsenate reductase (glutaredoxin)